jgi:hypothetical protein
VQANLIVGGMDPGTGRATLRALHPHGSMDENLSFTALGSGGLAAMAVLEQGFYRARLQHAAAKRAQTRRKRQQLEQQRGRDEATSDPKNDNDKDGDNNYEDEDDEVLPLEQAIKLVKNAIRAGIENDLGSGSQIDLCIMTTTGGDGGGGGGTKTVYQRCAVPEEQLEPILLQQPQPSPPPANDGSEPMPEPAAESSSSLEQTPRVVCLAPQQETRAKEELWAKVLGL